MYGHLSFFKMIIFFLCVKKKKIKNYQRTSNTVCRRIFFFFFARHQHKVNFTTLNLSDKNVFIYFFCVLYIYIAKYLSISIHNVIEKKKKTFELNGRSCSKRYRVRIANDLIIPKRDVTPGREYFKK